YRSVAVCFDPLRTDYDALIDRLECEAGASAPGASDARLPIRIPVCYGGEFGPDIGRGAAVGAAPQAGGDGLHPARPYPGYNAEVIGLHTARLYRVYMLGFVPGFAYMGTVDARIAAPRHATPRVRTPVGSVAIGGVQTGIYPAETPGGWQVIGRSPIKPFDPAR